MEIKSNLQTEIFKKIGTSANIRVDELSKNADLDKITKNNGRSEFIVKTNTDKLVSVSSSSFSTNSSNIKVGDKIKFSDNIEVEVVKKNKEMSTPGRILAATAIALGAPLLTTAVITNIIPNPKAAAGIAIGSIAVSTVAAGIFLFNKKFNDTTELDKASVKTITIQPPKPEVQKTSPSVQKTATPAQTIENKNSIYGANVSVENAKQWLTNNPEQVTNPKLLQIADYDADGAISPENLSQAANAGTVVLNGVKSFYIPGETVSEAEKAQTAYHKAAKQGLDAEKAKRNGEAVGAAIGLAALLGGAVIDEVNRNLR